MSIYRVSHRFVRLEALGTFGQNGRYNDPADPISLEVRITRADDIENIVESASTEGSSPSKPFRLSTGLWAYDLTPGYYTPGVQYTANFRYSMTPSALKVDRYNFTWNPILAAPRVSENCVVHGSVMGPEGSPRPDVRITVEQYKDFVTLNHRTGIFEVVSDVFGNWFAEVPRSSILRFVYNDLSKIIRVPELNAVALSAVAPYQAADGRKDAYGYPLP